MILEEPIIDFEIPNHLILHYYISGAISLFLNALVVYLILFHSGRLDSFRFYLLAFQVTCIISDLNITVLMQPVGLFPICAGHCNGILSRVFSVSSHVLMTLFTLLLSGQIEVLTICFLRKHKAIMNLRKMSKSTGWTYPIFYILCISFTFLIVFSIYMSGVSREEQMNTLEQLYPKLAPKFRALREFHYYIMTEWLYIFFILVTIGTLKSTVVVSVLVLRMYKTLQENSSRLSSKTMARHKTALRSLIMQFLTTPISFFPAFIIMLTVLFPTEYSQQISWYSLMVGTTHSISNSAVVIVTYPEFRKAALFWKKDFRKQSILVSSVRPSGA